MELPLDYLNLLWVLLAAWLSGAVAVRLGYPSVLGELLAGMILGPALLGLIYEDVGLRVLAEVGVLIMMLYIGMHIDPTQLGRSSWPGFLAAIGGFILPFGVVWMGVRLLGGTDVEGFVAGVAAAGTSLAMKSRILVDLRLLQTRLALVMMAAALVTDTLALIAFAGVMSFAGTGGGLEIGQLLMVAGKAAVFFAVTVGFGLMVLPSIGRMLTSRQLAAAGLTGRTFIFAFVLILAVGFGELAHLLGLHAILGSFIAGLFISDKVLGRRLAHELTEAVREASIGFLAPLFFVSAGFGVSFGVFVEAPLLVVMIVVVAIVAKIVGTVLFYIPSGNGWREGLAVATGMNGRGAVEIIVARISYDAGLIGENLFSAIVFMAILTTATVPLTLKWSTEWLRRRGELVQALGQRRGTLIVSAGATARLLARALRVPANVPLEEAMAFIPANGNETSAPAKGTHTPEPVWLIDTSPERCDLARKEGFSVVCGNALQEQSLAESGASEVRAVVTMTPNEEVNALAASLARNVFDVPQIFIAHGQNQRKGHQSSMQLLQAADLFAGGVDLAEWDRLIEANQTDVSVVAVSAESSAVDMFNRLQDVGPALPLAVRTGGEVIPFHSDLSLRSGDEVLMVQAKRASEMVNLHKWDQDIAATD